MWGALAAVGGSLLGGVLKNDAARTQAHEAQDFLRRNTRLGGRLPRLI